MGGVLPEPRGQQREVVYLDGRGHCVTLGVAGSGKTLMAVLRARYLASAPVFGGPTLLVTFNGALVTYLKSMVGDHHPGVTVEQYHLFARRFLAEHCDITLGVCGFDQRNALVGGALAAVRRDVGDTRAVLARPVGFFVDEFDWLMGHGITDLAAYVDGSIRRTGRVHGLRGPDREIVRDVFLRYQNLRARRGFDLDWSGVASRLQRALRRPRTSWPYRHVVVDEGQDFSPEMVRSLAALIPDDGSLTFFGDYAQQIYGRGLSWRSLGLRVTGGRVVRFDRNYRNTRQISDLAKAVSDMPFFADESELVVPVHPTVDGFRPAVVRADSKSDQLAQAARFANNQAYDRLTRQSSRRVAVLARDDTQLRHLVPMLDHRRKIKLHKGMAKWDHRPGIYYGPYAEARGLEFDAVILPFCDDDELPTAVNIEAFGAEEATVRQARELYVAVTRAQRELTIIHSSRLTRLLPDENSDLYERLG